MKYFWKFRHIYILIILLIYGKYTEYFNYDCIFNQNIE
jgi:hypothetical protein